MVQPSAPRSWVPQNPVEIKWSYSLSLSFTCFFFSFFKNIFIDYAIAVVEVFKVMKGMDLHPRLLYPAKLSFRMEGQIKCFFHVSFKNLRQLEKLVGIWWFRVTEISLCGCMTMEVLLTYSENDFLIYKIECPAHLGPWNPFQCMCWGRGEFPTPTKQLSRQQLSGQFNSTLTLATGR